MDESTPPPGAGQPEIARCPFCGSQPETMGSGEEQRGLMIQCLGENCPNPSTSYYDHASAIRVWNRRAPLAPPREVTEALAFEQALRENVLTLRACKDRFESYARHHAAKPDMEKATTNWLFAEKCQVALDIANSALLTGEPAVYSPDIIAERTALNAPARTHKNVRAGCPWPLCPWPVRCGHADKCLPTARVDADQEVFTRPECIFNYCPHKELCEEKCQSPNTKSEGRPPLSLMPSRERLWEKIVDDPDLDVDAGLPNALPARVDAPDENAPWQPIATAPKDRLVDLWWEGLRFCDCYYDQICDEWRTSRPGNRLFCGIKKPTHWMEQPRSPLAAVDAARERGDG